MTLGSEGATATATTLAPAATEGADTSSFHGLEVRRVYVDHEGTSGRRVFPLFTWGKKGGRGWQVTIDGALASTIGRRGCPFCLKVVFGYELAFGDDSLIKFGLLTKSWTRRNVSFVE